MKPLGQKSYGSIAHLPGSRLGIGDKRIHEGQAKICLEKPRKGDRIIVQEKLDGSCVSIAKINNEIIPLVKAGYVASTSSFEQHHMFVRWVKHYHSYFNDLLKENERVVGEWMAMAHGIKYDLPHQPFVAFDIMTKTKRVLFDEFTDRCKEFVTPFIHSDGPAFSMDQITEALKNSHHGGEFPEGVVYRVEREGKVDFLCKYVSGNHVCGKYFVKEEDGEDPVWNWKEKLS